MSYERWSLTLQLLSLFLTIIIAAAIGRKKPAVICGIVLTFLGYFIGQYILPVNQPPMVGIGLICLPLLGALFASITVTIVNSIRSR
jgi:hypothetical protein